MSNVARSEKAAKAGADARSWGSSPLLAWAVRAAIFLVPILLAWLMVRTVSGVLYRPDGSVGLLLWAGQAMVIGFATSRLAERGTHQFLPLASLLNMSLVFPDQAPSRFGLALRSGTLKQQQRRLDDVRSAGLGGSEGEAARRAVELVTVLGHHDRRTRGHTERVRAYADLIAQELGLPDQERQKLIWGAMLHDIGKLAVRPDILNKEGKPDEAEWAILKRHPAAGRALLEPLSDWLGDWLLAASEHHEKWDGSGYPLGLVGNEISLAGRITAVADAYDVMTSRRSYKVPIPAQEARQELVRCSGSQFDPEIVRAFLRVSVGRRWKVGPLAWLAELPAVARTISAVPSAVASTSVAAGAVIVGSVAVSAGVDPRPAQNLAFIEPIAYTSTTQGGTEIDLATSTTLPITVTSTVSGAESEVTTTTTLMLETTTTTLGDDTSTSASQPDASQPNGATTTSAPNTSAPITSAPNAAPPTTATPTSVASPTTSSVTTPTTMVTDPAPTTTSTAVESALILSNDVITVQEGKNVKIYVLENDAGDGSGFDEATLVILTEPAHSSDFRVHNDHLHYKPTKKYVGTDQIEYRVCTNSGTCATATISITIEPK